MTKGVVLCFYRPEHFKSAEDFKLTQAAADCNKALKNAVTNALAA
jgi:hypothetical protein